MTTTRASFPRSILIPTKKKFQKNQNNLIFLVKSAKNPHTTLSFMKNNEAKKKKKSNLVNVQSLKKSLN